MQATRILAIRHGETAWNTDGRIQGHLDIALNATGQAQARCTGAALAHEALDAIYSSDLQRAYATAQAIEVATGAPLRVEPGLRERCFGVLQGRTFAEIAAAWPDAARRWRGRDPDFAPEGGGESLRTLHARVAATVSRVAARHPGGQVALVAHGGVMDVLYRLATRQDVQAQRTWPLDNAAIHRLLWTPQGLTLVSWGDVRHLEGLGTVRDERFS